ncbi:MAG: hypothetical protein L3K07_00470 [Thermoplasmata archaeon]|nr:hypothetical protein [Thermoplasmata archaeon]
MTGTGTPGEFSWQLIGGSVRPVTSGTVAPADALVSATEYDPSAGGPAVQLVYRPADPSVSTSLDGSLTLTTPQAASYVVTVPPVLSAPGIWSQLGVRFVLMRNASFAPNPIVALPGESAYLVREYGLPILYQNPEWTVLLVPSPSV